MTQAAILAASGSPGTTTGFKNKLINGNMVIDQRNAGASVTPTVTNQYTLDRWQAQLSVTSKYSVQQNAGSITPPVGFTNYLGITSLSAYSVGSSDYFALRQQIEGYNIADLGWGTANAKTVTLSFWVRSSLTGTFGGYLNDAGDDYCYLFSYSIPTANTWTQISVTIAGPTSGTWNTTNGQGIKLGFGLGTGSTYTSTAGSWQAGVYVQPTGSVSVVGTSGATFYVTGVQLEVGTTATNFDFRSIGTELQLCQRYYQKSYPYVSLPGATVGNAAIQTSWGTPGSGICGNAVVFPVSMRTDPTLVIYDTVGNTAAVTVYNFGATPTDNVGLNTANATSSRMMVRIFGVSAAGMAFMYTVSAEL
jgi:hypothetical protein